MGMTIGKLIVQRDNFKVDETYQRPPDAWSNKDKQLLYRYDIKE